MKKLVLAVALAASFVAPAVAGQFDRVVGKDRDIIVGAAATALFYKQCGGQVTLAQWQVQVLNEFKADVDGLARIMKQKGVTCSQLKNVYPIMQGAASPILAKMGRTDDAIEAKRKDDAFEARRQQEAEDQRRKKTVKKVDPAEGKSEMDVMVAFSISVMINYVKCGGVLPPEQQEAVATQTALHGDLIQDFVERGMTKGCDDVCAYDRLIEWSLENSLK